MSAGHRFAGGNELGEQRTTAGGDFVADRPDGVDALSCGVGQTIVALATISSRCSSASNRKHTEHRPALHGAGVDALLGHVQPDPRSLALRCCPARLVDQLGSAIYSRCEKLARLLTQGRPFGLG